MGDDRIKQILTDTETIAVVGCSREPTKDAHRIPAFMRKMGYRILPINPHASDDILGESAFDSLEDAMANSGVSSIDLVDVFRPAEEAPGIAGEAVDIGADTLWLQLGIRSDEARSIAEKNGLEYVQDHCLYPEYTSRFGKTPRDQWLP
jgi:predicted CoA-binding protein